MTTACCTTTVSAPSKQTYLAVRFRAASQLAIPVGCKLHGLVHVVFILLRRQHQLHIRVNAAVALIGVAPHHFFTVHAGWGGPCLAHRAGQGELQLTAVTGPESATDEEDGILNKGKSS